MNYEEVIEVVAALVSLMMSIGLVVLCLVMWSIGVMEVYMGQPVGILCWLISGIVWGVVGSPGRLRVPQWSLGKHKKD